MSCFSFLFAKKPSPDPSQPSGNIEEPRDARFNRCQDLSSENDAQIVQKPPVEVAAEEGENDLRNIVAGERSTQFIIGHRPIIAWNIVAGNGACQVLGNYSGEFRYSSNPELTSERPPPPYPNKPSTPTQSSAGKDGGL